MSTAIAVSSSLNDFERRPATGRLDMQPSVQFSTERVQQRSTAGQRHQSDVCRRVHGGIASAHAADNDWALDVAV
jgi:hypothetical protein